MPCLGPRGGAACTVPAAARTVGPTPGPIEARAAPTIDSRMTRIFDGHNDTVLRLVLDASRDFDARGDVGHLDAPRARDGGFAGGLFAMFSPTDPTPTASPSRRPTGPLDAPTARGYTDRMFQRMFELDRRGALTICTSVSDIEAAMDAGSIAAVLHIEGAEAIAPDLSNLELYVRAGLRSLGLVWSRPNAFGTGVPFAFPGDPDIGPGLTDAGFDLVRACERLGVLVDVSHLNARGFWDVAEASSQPLVASHSNAHALCPTPRNLTDAQLAAVRASKGLVGLNLAVAFLREDGASNPDTPLDDVLRHLDHLLEHVGEDGVAFGSDFDGAVVPQEIGDVSGMPKLVAAMRAHGYGAELIEKIASRNWLRVLDAVWG